MHAQAVLPLVEASVQAVAGNAPTTAAATTLQAHAARVLQVLTAAAPPAAAADMSTQQVGGCTAGVRERHMYVQRLNAGCHDWPVG
jgi:hypothetical protein